MNEEYRFLETIANFLEQGYLIQDVLNICKYIYNNDRIEQLKLKLNEGKLKIIYLKQLYKVLIFVNQKILPL